MKTRVLDLDTSNGGIEQPAHVTLLGPYPGNRSISTTNYFQFFTTRLPLHVGNHLTISAACPGGKRALRADGLVEAARLQAWTSNYALWPFELRRLRSDLFHIIDQGIAWYARFLKFGLSVATVNDLIAYMSYRRKIQLPPPPPRRVPIVLESIRCLRRMDHLISASTFTADCMMTELDIPPSRITVIPHYIEEEWSPLNGAERPHARKRWFGDSEFVVIHVGKRSAYKNRIAALQAFARVLERLPGARMFLMPDGPDSSEERFLLEAGCGTSVRFLQNLSRADLREVYGAADVLVFPSLYEGFGWPPLEAMACGCPVVSSVKASLREVVGNAAIKIEDPCNIELIADALRTVLLDNSVATQLRTLGKQRAAQFSPEVALDKTAALYRSLL